MLDQLTYAGSRESLAAVSDHSELIFHQGDIGDGALLAALLAEFQPQAILNFAAETHVDRSIDAPAPFVSTNVVGTCQLLEQSLAYWRKLPIVHQHTFRFLHISTDEVYGPIESPDRATESHAYCPSSPYAASKAAADHFVRAFRRTYGLPVLLVHPSNSYGPYQFPEKLVPLMILNAVEGNPLPIYGDGRQSRDWLFGEDLCRAIRLVLEQGELGESFHVASGCEQTNLELVQQICALVDRLQPDLPHVPCTNLIQQVTDRPGHDIRYALDTEKIRDLGWNPRVVLATGLERTVRWYLENHTWVAEVAAKFDRTRRLGRE